MPPDDLNKPANHRFVTTSGVQIVVNGRDYDEPEEEEPPPDPFPTAIVFPPGQSLAERNAFMEGLDRQWGALIWSKLRRSDILEESAKDLYQEARVILFNHADKLKGPDEVVTAFIGTVVTHLICNHGRRARPDVAQGADVDAQPTGAPDPERALANAELWRKLQGYLGRLSPEEREVFEAREVGVTFEVIAVAVRRTVSTVTKQYHRAKQKLEDMARDSERSEALRARQPAVGAWPPRRG
jgi:RNA polymerase sigma factor (sigma-70 family)